MTDKCKICGGPRKISYQVKSEKYKTRFYTRRFTNRQGLCGRCFKQQRQDRSIAIQEKIARLHQLPPPMKAIAAQLGMNEKTAYYYEGQRKKRLGLVLAMFMALLCVGAMRLPPPPPAPTNHYYFVVICSSPLGKSDPSAEVSLTTTCRLSSVTLAWNASPDPSVRDNWIQWGRGHGSWTNVAPSVGTNLQETVSLIPPPRTNWFIWVTNGYAWSTNLRGLWISNRVANKTFAKTNDVTRFWRGLTNKPSSLSNRTNF